MVVLLWYNVESIVMSEAVNVTIYTKMVYNHSHIQNVLSVLRRMSDEGYC